MQEVSICTLGPDFDQDGVVDRVGRSRFVFSQWETGLSAGGCRNDLKLFATNPQFLLTLHQVGVQCKPISTHSMAVQKSFL